MGSAAAARECADLGQGPGARRRRLSGPAFVTAPHCLPLLSYLTSPHHTSPVCPTLIGFLVVSVNTPAAPPTLRSTVISGRVVGRHSNQCPWVEWRQIQFVHLTSPIKTTRFDRSVGQLLVCALLLSSAPHNHITSHLCVRYYTVYMSVRPESI